MTEYGAEQLTAGFRAMRMLAGLVQRGGRPAAVAPTIPLRGGEKQYGWLPVTVGGHHRQVAVITNQRLIVGEEIPLWAITRIRPVPGEWAVLFEVRRRAEPLLLGGPWVPWLSVVVCAELYGTALPPTLLPPTLLPPTVLPPTNLPAQRGTAGNLPVAAMDLARARCDA